MSQIHQNSHLHLSPHKLSIDRQQATIQIKVLGHSLSDAVRIRAFLPKEDPNYGPNTGRKADKLNWEQIEGWQAQGYGVYIVVNGGGHKDEDVTHCRAIFCEFDDRPIENQIWFWRELGLPEPSLQVQTRKSVHTYWVFDEPIAVDAWRDLQSRLLTYTGSDPALKNPSRVMRLAGAYHIKPGHEPLRCDIIHNSKQRYSYLELNTTIPALTPSPSSPAQSRALPLLESLPELHGAAPHYQRYEEILVPVPQLVPLEVCLSKKSRTLLDSGVSEGGRNTNGAKLARDLIGTANYLYSIGQRVDGEPRQMLDEYASRCTPPLSAKEVDAIWKSAEIDCPGPSCKAEGVEACVRAWYWKHHVKPDQLIGQNSAHFPTHHSGLGFGSSNSSKGASAPPFAAVSLIERIRDILNRYEQESLQVNALMDLAGATGRTYNEISQLARIIRAEGDLASEVIEAVQSFQGTLKSCRKRLDIRHYIDSTLAEPLLTKAAAMPTAAEYLFNTLLASSASRIGTSARVIVNPEGGYVQPCIFWTANVAHSGQAKTPPQQVIVKPLEEMEADAKQMYDIQLADYETDNKSDAKSPIRQRRLLNNVTTSTKIRIHEENQHGLLEYIDELVADYQRLNQFKNGKGDDLQLELSFWNGAGGNYDRSDVRLFLKRSGFSKTGTYQWDTLARLMADDVNFIASGYSARFLYCSVLDAPARYLDLLSNRSPDTLKEKLSWLYGELERLPEADYLLSHEAKVLFQSWNHTLVNAEMAEAHFGLSLVYAKIESYTARIALWLHLVNAVLRGEKPAPVISGETMQHAIEIASFYLWQHKLIHAHNAPTRSLEGIFLKVQTQAEKFFAKCGKGVGASFLKTRINALKSWVVEKIRSTVFKTLDSNGFGRIEGEGSEMVYIPNTVPAPDPGKLVAIGDESVDSPIAQNIARTEFRDSIGEIGETKDIILISQLPESPIAPSTNPRTVASTGETSAEQYAHQFTNSNAKTATVAEFQPIGNTTNSSPTTPTAPTPLGEPQPPTTHQLAALILQCQTWVELATHVGENASSLLVASKTMTKEQRSWLTHLLANHLCQKPAYLSQMEWIPAKLRDRALSRLTFTIQKIGGVASSVLDARLEYLAGCKFVSVARLGTRQEQWIFLTVDGKNIPVFGTEAIEVIALSARSANALT